VKTVTAHCLTVKPRHNRSVPMVYIVGLVWAVSQTTSKRSLSFRHSGPQAVVRLTHESGHIPPDAACL
jgi:hypothetical protein